ncbi:hypothetical protein WR25_04626 [Diploscapter pachys]|uniref:PH domain-containing protein n=1 Tax=Diploscapter pachys TaxID=2018661 RepID=A0A2A2JMD6_9BILA|nr:hypothetical protein WR25_04626 [Diploscapter pachys]
MGVEDSRNPARPANLSPVSPPRKPKAARRHFFRRSKLRPISRTSSFSSNGPVSPRLMSLSSTRGGSLSSLNTNITEEKAGYLSKWVNYIKGYRQRWFVLDSNGVLSYYSCFCCCNVLIYCDPKDIST